MQIRRHNIASGMKLIDRICQVVGTMIDLPDPSDEGSTRPVSTLFTTGTASPNCLQVSRKPG